MRIKKRKEIPELYLSFLFLTFASPLYVHLESYMYDDKEGKKN